MIECNPDKCWGQPSLVGMRLTVRDIVTKIYYEDTLASALEDYNISLADAKEAVSYCMNLKCKEDKALLHYCDGCLLRTLAEGWEFKRENYIEIKDKDHTFVKSIDGTVFFLGTMQEFEDSEFGTTTWLTAEELNKKLFSDGA